MILTCQTLTASAIYGGAATQIQNQINNAVSTKQNTLVNVPGTGETILESGFIKKIYCFSFGNKNIFKSEWCKWPKKC